jgi:hypothetical protein
MSSSVLTSHSAQSKVNRLRTSSASRVHALSSGAVDASLLRSRRMSAYWSRIACLSPSPTSAMRREIDRTISVSSATAVSWRGVARSVSRVPRLNSHAGCPGAVRIAPTARTTPRRSVGPRRWR